jgi:outer membrane protein assembly factor BamE (lipoprotein component of BamABCDE complex)
MANKDYYAILMVHPSAEKFLIDAAYKRLAREYHPDVNSGVNAHQKMIDINEAYEVLSDPMRRKVYDQTYRQKASGDQDRPRNSWTNSTSKKTERPSQRSTSTPYDKREVPPVPPNPHSFGIDSRYLERAIEGALAWQKRKRRLSKDTRWIIRIAYLIAATIGPVLLSSSHSPYERVAWFALLGLLLGEVSIWATEHAHDAKLKRTEFDPLYNPNPSGYSEYASALARYESEIIDVYVSRNWICHSNNYCCGMSNYSIMPKWKAYSKNARPCARCRQYSVLPKKLPPPFGNGRLPKEPPSYSSGPSANGSSSLSPWGRPKLVLASFLVVSYCLFALNHIHTLSSASKTAIYRSSRLENLPSNVTPGNSQFGSGNANPQETMSTPQPDNVEDDQLSLAPSPQDLSDAPTPSVNGTFIQSTPTTRADDVTDSADGTGSTDATLDNSSKPAKKEIYDKFTVGSTKAEVLMLQGTPDSFTDYEFRYGTSHVYFRNEQVVRWNNGFPELKAVLVPATVYTKGYFTIGSTLDELLSAQGTPDSFSDYDYRYGTSHVYFTNGRITRWNNGFPKLKAQYPVVAISQSDDYFTIGATKDDVASIQGTPDSFTEYEFRYGTSHVYFSAGAVKRWNNGFPKLRAKLAPSGSAPVNDYFTVGSTKDDVLFIQGTPDSFSDNEFRYGTSHVYFVGDRVRNWNNGFPRLKVKL